LRVNDGFSQTIGPIPESNGVLWPENALRLEQIEKIRAVRYRLLNTTHLEGVLQQRN
jgi:hypothetical protein